MRLPALRHPESPAQRLRRRLRRMTAYWRRRVRDRDFETSRWLVPRYEGPRTIERVFFVNLESSTDRREDMQKHLASVGAPFERFPAIHGTHDREAYADYLAERPSLPPSIRPSGEVVPYEVTDGLVGCWLSHVHVIRHIASLDEGLYLVLEDDYHLPPDWKERVEALLNEIPDDWTVLKLWNSALNGKPTLRGTRVSENLVRLGPSLFTQQNLSMVSYLVRNQGPHARNLYTALEHKPVMHADDALNAILDDVSVYAPRRQVGTLGPLGLTSDRVSADQRGP